MNGDDKIIVFKDKNIRRVWRNGEWFFSVVDVVGILSESSIPRRYWADLKSKMLIEGFQLYEKIVQLKMKSIDGKRYGLKGVKGVRCLCFRGRPPKDRVEGGRSIHSIDRWREFSLPITSARRCL